MSQVASQRLQLEVLRHAQVIQQVWDPPLNTEVLKSEGEGPRVIRTTGTSSWCFPVERRERLMRWDASLPPH